MRNDIPVYLLIMAICGLLLTLMLYNKVHGMYSVTTLMADVEETGYFTEMDGNLMSVDMDLISQKIVDVKIIGQPKKKKFKKEKKVELSGPIDINVVTLKEFEKLPGIGAIVAERIVKKRSELGGKFKKLSDLVQVKGISLNKVIKVQKWLTIEGAPIEKLEVKVKGKKGSPKIELSEAVNINTANADRLQALPGIGKKKAESIILKRKELAGKSGVGGFKTIEDLALVKGISLNKVSKLEEWISVKDKKLTPKKDVLTGEVEKKVEIKKIDDPLVKSSTPLIDINTATLKELTSLPGIGPSTAKNIITYREGSKFSKVEDIMNVKRIGEKSLLKFKHLIKVGTEISIKKPDDIGKIAPTAQDENKKIETIEVVKDKVDVSPVKTDDQLIDINTATLEELTSLPGIGPSTAENIIKYREETKFSKIEDITNVKRIGEKSLLKFKHLIKISSGSLVKKNDDVSEIAPISQKETIEVVDESKEIENIEVVKDKGEKSLININTATLEELTTLPGIGPSTAENIIKYREETKFSKIEDIINVKRIGPKSLLKFKDLIRIK